jgi:hypothetical protein
MRVGRLLITDFGHCLVACDLGSEKWGTLPRRRNQQNRVLTTDT